MRSSLALARRISISLLALMLMISACVSSVRVVSAQGTEAEITRVTASILAHSQFAHHPLDRELADKLLARYADALDGSRTLLLQSDVDQYSGSGGTLAHAILFEGDTNLAHQLWRVYLQRLQQRVQYVAGLLHTGRFDFKGQDSYLADREDAARPKDLGAAQELWRQRLRADYLDEKLNGTAKAQIVDKLSHRYEQQLQTMQALPAKDVTSTFINALASVYDPHSEYLDHEQLQSFEMMMSLSLFGIGATLENQEGYCTVRDILPGGPAAHSSLTAGDRIIAVAQAGEASVSIMNMPLSRAVQLIRGPKGSRVTLTVRSGGSGDSTPTHDVTIIRDEVQLEDQEAKAYILDVPQPGGTQRLGVIDIPSFYASTDPRAKARKRSVTADVARLVKKLVAEKVRGIALDLRNNGGGSLDEAIHLTGLFIPKGPVVQTRGPTGKIGIGADTDPAELYKGPLLVVISRMSASASEIMAGALKDYGRALIVGDSSTFGKGTVQSLVPLGPLMLQNGLRVGFDPGALKVTISKFYRPSGASTQLRGVAADIVIPSNTDLSRINESALDNPLPWDTVKPVSFVRADRVQPYLAALRAQSAARVAADSGFEYLKARLATVREHFSNHPVSLNEAARRAELSKDKTLQQDLERWWRARQQDAPKSYELRLKDLLDPELPTAEPFAALNDQDLAEAAKAATAAARSAVLANGAASDVVLSEAVHILSDYVSLTEAPTPSESGGA